MSCSKASVEACVTIINAVSAISPLLAKGLVVTPPLDLPYEGAVSACEAVTPISFV